MRSITKKIVTILPSAFFASVILIYSGNIQAQPVTDDDSTITYPAEFFAQYQPFSVNDMLDRIPGINVARQGSQSESGPGSSSGPARRGLGLGGDQVLINGRRITGKGNEGDSQLSRIPANQVQYIEIIRGTSNDLDVRGGNQVINIVLVEAESSNSTAFELSTNYYHDGEFKPGGKISLTGQNGNLNYLVSAESESGWRSRPALETSILPDGTLNENIKRLNTRDSQPLSFSTNLGYEFSDTDIVHFNALYNDNDAPNIENRVIIDQLSTPPAFRFEFDDTENSNEFWEVGGDFEHTFSDGGRWKTLFIANKREDSTLRERFDVEDNNLVKDMLLDTFNRYQERIARSSYSFDFGQNQGLEIGIERAQTTLDSSLLLELNLGISNDTTLFGGLTPVTNSNATVEEIRYETFAVHNWQINQRMSLESTLIVETSEIEQSGDVSKTRDFDFIRPKLDYRFDITPTLQFRATVEKDVAQLSFNDFTANVNETDLEQDAVAGNPDIRQEQSWRYDMNLEYRFNNDNGVISGNIFYHDIEDVIGKIDVSTDTRILSANGNIGDGERYGIGVNASLRLGLIELPGILITSQLLLEDSSVTDPFLGTERRLSRNGQGTYNLGFRHDIPSRNINYGLSYGNWVGGTSKAFDVYDIDKIESYSSDASVTLFAEMQGWAGLTYRFEGSNPQESWMCRDRYRYTDGTIATGNLSEIETSCAHTGERYAIMIRGTF